MKYILEEIRTTRSEEVTDFVELPSFAVSRLIRGFDRQQAEADAGYTGRSAIQIDDYCRLVFIKD